MNIKEISIDDYTNALQSFSQFDCGKNWVQFEKGMLTLPTGKRVTVHIPKTISKPSRIVRLIGYIFRMIFSCCRRQKESGLKDDLISLNNEIMKAESRKIKIEDPTKARILHKILILFFKLSRLPFKRFPLEPKPNESTTVEEEKPQSATTVEESTSTLPKPKKLSHLEQKSVSPKEDKEFSDRSFTHKDVVFQIFPFVSSSFVNQKEAKTFLDRYYNFPVQRKKKRGKKAPQRQILDCFQDFSSKLSKKEAAYGNFFLNLHQLLIENRSISPSIEGFLKKRLREYIFAFFHAHPCDSPQLVQEFPAFVTLFHRIIRNYGIFEAIDLESMVHRSIVIREGVAGGISKKGILQFLMQETNKNILRESVEVQVEKISSTKNKAKEKDLYYKLFITKYPSSYLSRLDAPEEVTGPVTELEIAIQNEIAKKSTLSRYIKDILTFFREQKELSRVLFGKEEPPTSKEILELFEEFRIIKPKNHSK